MTATVHDIKGRHRRPHTPSSPAPLPPGSDPLGPPVVLTRADIEFARANTPPPRQRIRDEQFARWFIDRRFSPEALEAAGEPSLAATMRGLLRVRDRSVAILHPAVP